MTVYEALVLAQAMLVLIYSMLKVSNSILTELDELVRAVEQIWERMMKMSISMLTELDEMLRVVEKTWYRMKNSKGQKTRKNK